MHLDKFQVGLRKELQYLIHQNPHILCVSKRFSLVGSFALIETIGSMGSLLIIDSNREIAVGLEVNANHVNGISSGFVLARGKIIHAGRKTHLWQVDITEEGSNKLICVGKLTVMILEKREV